MFATAQELAQRVSDDFIRGPTFRESLLVSPKHVIMMTQRPESRALVPIERPPDDDAPRPRPGAVEFEPSPEFVLSRLLPKYLEFTLYSAMLETDACSTRHSSSR